MRTNSSLTHAQCSLFKLFGDRLEETFGQYVFTGLLCNVLEEGGGDRGGTRCERPPPTYSILQFRRDFGKGQNFCNSRPSLKLEYVGPFHGKHDQNW